jgi:hypothetical protein
MGVTVGVAERDGEGDGKGVMDGRAAGSGVAQEAPNNTSGTNQKGCFFIVWIVMLLD